jgi:hypothetical protein
MSEKAPKTNISEKYDYTILKINGRNFLKMIKTIHENATHKIILNSKGQKAFPQRSASK